MYSRYTKPENGGNEVNLLPLPAKASEVKPIPKKRNRAPRGFSIYTYRGLQFIFTYKEDKALVALVNGTDTGLTAKVIVPKDKAYIAARALTRILETEKELTSLSQLVPVG